MQISGMVQELKAEIAQLEQDNLELQGELQMANARYELLRAVVLQLVEEL